MNHKLPILPLLLVVVFASCSPAKSEQMSKNAFSGINIEEYDSLDWPALLKQKEDDYLVFFYSDTCAHCHEIIEDVQAFIEDEIVKTYLLNTKKTSVPVPINYDIEKTIGASNVDDVFIKGTPSLIEVEKGIVTANEAGSEKCLTFLNKQRLLHKT